MICKSMLDPQLILKVANWHFRYYFLGQGRPLLAVVYVTSRCNFKCRMCEIISTESWKEQPAMGSGAFKNIVDELASLGCYYIYITGGEPTILKDIVERVEYAKGKIPYVGMVSNGFFIDDELAGSLYGAGLDILSISIDGMARIHNEIRGNREAFEKAVGALKSIKQNTGLGVCINTVVSPWNIGDLSSVLSLSREYGAFHKFQPINLPFSFGETDRGFFDIGEEKLNTLYNFAAELIKEKKETGRILNGLNYIKKIPDYFRALSQGKIPTMYGLEGDCTLPFYHIEIKPDGSVHPCNYNQWKDRFIITEKTPLSKIILSKEYRELQEKLRQCDNCNRYMFLCYLEPRYIMPVQNFIKSTLNNAGL